MEELSNPYFRKLGFLKVISSRAKFAAAVFVSKQCKFEDWLHFAEVAYCHSVSFLNSNSTINSLLFFPLEIKCFV